MTYNTRYKSSLIQSVLLSFYLSVCLSVLLSFFLSLCISIFLSVFLSFFLSVYFSAPFSFFLSVSSTLLSFLSFVPIPLRDVAFLFFPAFSGVNFTSYNNMIQSLQLHRYICISSVPKNEIGNMSIYILHTYIHTYIYIYT